MRVIGGTARGRRLSAPKDPKIRPTSDRAREAVFDVLSHLDVVEGASVVDLFAGSGAMGIEALSRGAAFATFVESDKEAVAVIEANLTSTGLGTRSSARVVRSDVLAWCRTAGQADIAFVDPPYVFDGWPRLLSVLLADLVVLESRREVELPPEYELHRRYHYGGTLVTVARKSSAVPSHEPEGRP